MANPDTPFGLRPVRYLNGAPWNGQANKYYVDSTYATALYLGDVVDIATGLDTTGMHTTVAKATLADGNYTIGPIVAMEESGFQQSSNIYIPASTGGYVYVADDPNLIFEVQCDSASDLAYGDIPGNCILVDGGGSTITGLSGMELDESSITVDSSNMLLLWRLANRPDNEIGAHCKALVMISMHRFRSVTDGLLGVTA